MSFDLVSTSYSPNKTKQYRLSIREASNGFSFSVVNVVAKQCERVGLLSDPKTLSQIFDLNLPYNSIRVVLDKTTFSFVSEKMFQADEATNYLLTDDLHKKRAHTNITKIPTFNVFSICNSRGLFEVASTINKVEYMHPIVMLLNTIDNITPMKKVYLDVCGEMSHVLIIEANKILLANTFDTETIHDILYYILLVYKSLNLNVEQVPLIISGDRYVDVLETCQNYIAKVELRTNEQSNFVWNAEFDKKQMPKFSLIL